MAAPLGLLWSDYSHWALEAAGRVSGQLEPVFYIDILKGLVQTDNKNGQIIISCRAEQIRNKCNNDTKVLICPYCRELLKKYSRQCRNETES